MNKENPLKVVVSPIGVLNTLEFTGKNFLCLKTLIGNKLRQNEDGRAFIVTDRETTIFKGDTIDVAGSKIKIKKPAYLGGEVVEIEVNK